MAGRHTNNYSILFRRLFKFKPFFSYTDRKLQAPSADKVVNLLNESTISKAPRLQRESIHLQNRVSRILNKDAAQLQADQRLFIDTHFGTILNHLHAISATGAQPPAPGDARYNYASLTPRQLDSLIARTASQDELLRIFDALLRSGTVSRRASINILLNRALVNQNSINLVLYKIMEQASRSVQSRTDGRSSEKKGAQWSKADFICLQAALTQKFFMLKRLDFVKNLVSLNFEENWLPFIIGQQRSSQEDESAAPVDDAAIGTLPFAIERSIWRIFFMFVKDYELLALLIRDNKLSGSSLVLLYEALPKNLIYEVAHIKDQTENTLRQQLRQQAKSLIQILTDKLSSLETPVSKFHRFFLDLLASDTAAASPYIFNELKLVSITSKVSKSFVIQHNLASASSSPASFDILPTDPSGPAAQLQSAGILNIQNPLSQTLFAALDEKSKSSFRAISGAANTTNNNSAAVDLPSVEFSFERHELMKLNQILVTELNKLLTRLGKLKQEDANSDLADVSMEEIEGSKRRLEGLVDN